MLDKSNPYYKEITLIIPLTNAETTIAWFYSGKKQSPNINSYITFPVLSYGVFDCTETIQRILNYG